MSCENTPISFSAPSSEGRCAAQPFKEVLDAFYFLFWTRPWPGHRGLGELGGRPGSCGSSAHKPHQHPRGPPAGAAHACHLPPPPGQRPARSSRAALSPGPTRPSLLTALHRSAISTLTEPRAPHTAAAINVTHAPSQEI